MIVIAASKTKRAINTFKIFIERKTTTFYLNSVSELGTQQRVGVGNTLFSVTLWSATRVRLLIP
jgi:hypothetical protein